MNQPPEPLGVADAVDISGEVREVATEGWPEGYVYGATRYADVILRHSYPGRFTDLLTALKEFHPTLDELRAGGGGRTVFVARFDTSLAVMHRGCIWGKQSITIEKTVRLDGTPVRMNRTRGHEIDMFGKGSVQQPLPGVAVEMEWNNKDPFFDRDLINFQALHSEGAIAVAVIVTRGPRLQALIGHTIRSKDDGLKYGQSTTHWEKLIPKVNLGGGGQCPLLLIGIEPERIRGIALAEQVAKGMAEAAAFKVDWRATHASWEEAKPTYVQMMAAARDLMPPLAEAKSAGAAG